MFCIGCGAGLPPDARFCQRCGRAVPQSGPTATCLACQAPLPPGQPRCPSCGCEHQYCPYCGSLVQKANPVCANCRAATAASAGSYLQPKDYEHPSMQSVNRAMRKNPIFNATAEMVSKKFGKRWYESMFTSIPATERQYQRLFEVARIGAGRLGLPKMPDLYVESSRGYASATFGTKSDAFVNVGSFLLRLLRDRELLFVVGHEYGHLIGDHALWMTVTTFAFGEHRSSLMAGGVFGLMSPTRLMSAGVEAAITNWMRIADFTADRVGLLVAGDFETARRALFLLYQKNRADLAEVDLDDWMRQQAETDPQITKITQLMTSGVPYLGVRLNELKAFHESPQYRQAKEKLDRMSEEALDRRFDEQGSLKRKPKPTAQPGSKPRTAAPPSGRPGTRTELRGACPGCRRPVILPVDKLAGRDRVTVTCRACRRSFVVPVGRILASRGAAPAAGQAAPAPPRAAPAVRALKRVCPGCGKALAVALNELPNQPYVTVRCNGCRRTYRFSLAEMRAAKKEIGSSGP